MIRITVETQCLCVLIHVSIIFVCVAFTTPNLTYIYNNFDVDKYVSFMIKTINFCSFRHNFLIFANCSSFALRIEIYNLTFISNCSEAFRLCARTKQLYTILAGPIHTILLVDLSYCRSVFIDRLKASAMH